jgi:Protein of unknown function (DUF3592)/Mu transposase, C-terminal
MLTVIGILVAVAGGLAVLAGATAMHRVRRLRRAGVPVWARTLDPPPPDDWQSAGGPRELLIQYTLADGRVFEQTTLAVAGRKAPLTAGQKVLVWYDPEDPGDVLVYGRWGRFADRAFVAVGTLFILIGGWLALFHP